MSRLLDHGLCLHVPTQRPYGVDLLGLPTSSHAWGVRECSHWDRAESRPLESGAWRRPLLTHTNGHAAAAAAAAGTWDSYQSAAVTATVPRGQHLKSETHCGSWSQVGHGKACWLPR